MRTSKLWPITCNKCTQSAYKKEHKEGQSLEDKKDVKKMNSQTQSKKAMNTVIIVTIVCSTTHSRFAELHVNDQ